MKAQKWSIAAVAAHANKRLAHVESKARDLYEIYRHRAGAPPTAFELLRAAERQAWLEVAESAIDNPECGECERPLVCHACMKEHV